MKYLRSVILCVLLLALSVGIAFASSPPAGYVPTVVTAITQRQHPGGFVNFDLHVINGSWGESADVVIMDLGGSVVGATGSPVPDLWPAYPFDDLRTGCEAVFTTASIEVPVDALPGTVYSYHLNHYNAMFKGDFSQIWNDKTGEWEANTAGYFVNTPLPRYDAIPDYARSLLSWDFTVTVVPEPASLAGLLTGVVGIAGLSLRRRSA